MSAQPFSFENENIIPDQMNMEFNAPIISRNDELINFRRNEIIGSNQSSIMDDDNVNNVNINNINEKYNFEFNNPPENTQQNYEKEYDVQQQQQQQLQMQMQMQMQEQVNEINNEDNQKCCTVLSSQLDSLSKKVNKLTTQSKSNVIEEVSNTKLNNLSIFNKLDNKDPIDILVYCIPVLLFFILLYSILKNRNNISESQNVPSIFRSYYPNRL